MGKSKKEMVASQLKKTTRHNQERKAAKQKRDMGLHKRKKKHKIALNKNVKWWIKDGKEMMNQLSAEFNKKIVVIKERQSALEAMSDNEVAAIANTSVQEGIAFDKKATIEAILKNEFLPKKFHKQKQSNQTKVDNAANNVNEGK